MLLEERLKKLKDGVVLIPPEKRKRTNEEYDHNRNLWKKRRSMVHGAILRHNGYVINLNCVVSRDIFDRD